MVARGLFVTSLEQMMPGTFVGAMAVYVWCDSSAGHKGGVESVVTPVHRVGPDVFRSRLGVRYIS